MGILKIIGEQKFTSAIIFRFVKKTELFEYLRESRLTAFQ